MAFEGMDFGILNRGVPQIDVAGSMGKGMQLRDMMQARKDDDTMRELSKQAGGNPMQLADLASGQGLYKQAQATRKQHADYQNQVAETAKKLAETDKLRLGLIQAGNEDVGKMAIWADTPEKWKQGIEMVMRDHPILQQGLQPFVQFNEDNRKAVMLRAATVGAALETIKPKIEEQSGAMVPVTTDILGQRTAGAPVGFKAQDAGTKIQQDRSNELANAKTDAERTAINKFYDARIRKINEPGMAAMMMPVGGHGATNFTAPLSDPGQEAIAQAIARGDQNPQEYNIRNPFAQAINSRAAVIAQGGGSQLLGKSQVAARAAGIKDFEPQGKAGQTIVALNTMTEHLGTAQRLAQALQNGDVQMVNQLSQTLQAQTGQPAPTDFATVRQFLAGEVAKVAAGGHLTEGEIKQAAERLSAAQSPAQLAGALDTMREIAGGKLVALDQDYRRLKGKSLAEDGRLTPATRQAFQSANQHISGGVGVQAPVTLAEIREAVKPGGKYAGKSLDEVVFALKKRGIEVK